jgi:hypothetical protein
MQWQRAPKALEEAARQRAGARLPTSRSRREGAARGRLARREPWLGQQSLWESEGSRVMG